MKKIVLTGGPCSGKTTTINELEKRGFDVVEEFAREVLQEREGFETSSKELLLRQKLMFERQLEKEKKFEDYPPLLKLLFLDRGVVDILAYSDHSLGFVPDEFTIAAKKKSYHKVFFLEQFPFQQDGLRIEKDIEEAKQIHEKIYSFYHRMGYNVVKVPAVSVEERVNFILKNLN
jgi:predicted ATPase